MEVAGGQGEQPQVSGLSLDAAQVTAHIPQRNTLLIGGDFNCTVRRLHRHVGSALSPVREAANDQEDFLSVIYKTMGSQY